MTQIPDSVKAFFFGMIVVWLVNTVIYLFSISPNGFYLPVWYAFATTPAVAGALALFYILAWNDL
jgi:hypothetical protein